MNLKEKKKKKEKEEEKKKELKKVIEESILDIDKKVDIYREKLYSEAFESCMFVTNFIWAIIKIGNIVTNVLKETEEKEIKEIKVKDEKTFIDSGE